MILVRLFSFCFSLSKGNEFVVIDTRFAAVLRPFRMKVSLAAASG
jgi:hypothetical protein